MPRSRREGVKKTHLFRVALSSSVQPHYIQVSLNGELGVQQVLMSPVDFSKLPVKWVSQC